MIELSFASFYNILVISILALSCN